MNVKQLGLFILIIFWQKAFAQNIVKEIADIEVAFAADAQKLGVQPAFLKYLDVNSLGFENGMAYNAYTFWQKNNDTGLLAWQAKYIEVAASGKLAYSYGPYQYFAQKTDSIPLFTGYFTSIWQKNIENQWKLLVDMGLPNDKSISFNRKNFQAKSSSILADTSTINLAILTVDIFLNNKLNKGSNVSTYFAKNALKISANNQPINYKTQKVVSDISGQLAYTYGTATAGSKVSNYLRIWRKIKPKSWLVVYEMVN